MMQDCSQLQEVVHSYEPFGLDDCARFDDDAACCTLHRVLDQPCQHVNGTCQRTYADPATVRTKRLEHGRGVHGPACRRHGDAEDVPRQPPRLGRECATRPVVARNPAEALSLSAIWLQVPHRKDIAYTADWQPRTSASGRWSWSACEGLRNATSWLNRTKHDVVARCVRPGDQTRNTECPLHFCRKREGRHSCTAQSAAKLVKFRCAARPVAPSTLARWALSRPMLIGRSGNGELQRLVAGLDLMSQGFSIPGLFELPERLWQDKALSFLFNHGRPGDRRNAMQCFATQRSEMGLAMQRFFDEYLRALVAQDREMLWDDQCQATLVLRCRLSQLGADAKVRRAQPALAANAEALSQMRGMLHYNLSLGFWLEMLESFARRRARLLIVTGFAASVERQIPRLHHIHPRRNLSGLTFRVLAAPMQTPRMGTPGWPLPADPRQENYAAHLDKMMASAEWDPNLNDVALLGCGPLGLPLARHAKEKGLSAIYVGGLLQILFGIAGRRYLEKMSPTEREVGGLAVKVFNRQGLVNEHWIRPLDSETPRNFRDQEGGAYWRRRRAM